VYKNLQVSVKCDGKSSKLPERVKKSKDKLKRLVEKVNSIFRATLDEGRKILHSPNWAQKLSRMEDGNKNLMLNYKFCNSR